MEGLNDFDLWSAYILPKRELIGKPITFVMKEKNLCVSLTWLVGIDSGLDSCMWLQILGQPMELEDAKYHRNSYFFNLCLVTTAAPGLQPLFQPLAQKLAAYLADLETEDEFLWRDETRLKQLPRIMTHILQGLQSRGTVRVPVNPTTSISLQLIRPMSLPPASAAVLEPSLVPVFTRQPPEQTALDVLSQKLCGLINGRRSLAQLSVMLQLDVDLVVSTVRHLEHYGLAVALPAFHYRNIYVATPALHRLFAEPGLQAEAAEFVALPGERVEWRELFRLYASLQRGLSVGEWCLRSEPRRVGVDEHRLMQFGLIRGLVAECEAFPVYTGREEERELWESAFTGHRRLAELAQSQGIPAAELEAQLSQRSERIAIIWK